MWLRNLRFLHDQGAFYLFNNLPGCRRVAFARFVGSAHALRSAKACKVHTNNLFQVWTHELSTGSGDRSNGFELAALSLPRLHVWRMHLCAYGTDGVSVGGQDLNIFGVSLLLLQYNKEILTWLNEGSWDVVPDHKDCKLELLVCNFHGDLFRCSILFNVILLTRIG